MKVSSIAIVPFTKYQTNTKQKTKEKHIKNTEINKTNISFCSNILKNGWFVFNVHDSQNEEKQLHVFFQENKPKLCLNIEENNLITDIQGEENSSMIPVCYLEELENYIKKSNLKNSFNANYKFAQTQRRLKRYPTSFYNEVLKAGKEKDLKVFFEKLDIQFDPITKTLYGNLNLDKDLYNLDSISLGELIQDCDLTFEDVFSQINIIEGDFNSHYHDFRNLGAIEEIQGDVEICNNKKLISLGNLKIVKGNLNLRNCSKLKSIGDLKEVFGNINLFETKVEDKEIEKFKNHNKVIISKNGEII